MNSNQTLKRKVYINSDSGISGVISSCEKILVYEFSTQNRSRKPLNEFYLLQPVLNSRYHSDLFVNLGHFAGIHGLLSRQD